MNSKNDVQMPNTTVARSWQKIFPRPASFPSRVHFNIFWVQFPTFLEILPDKVNPTISLSNKPWNSSNKWAGFAISWFFTEIYIRVGAIFKFHQLLTENNISKYFLQLVGSKWPKSYSADVYLFTGIRFFASWSTTSTIQVPGFLSLILQRFLYLEESFWVALLSVMFLVIIISAFLWLSELVVMHLSENFECITDVVVTKGDSVSNREDLCSRLGTIVTAEVQFRTFRTVQFGR